MSDPVSRIRHDYFGKAKNSGSREAPCIAWGVIHDEENPDALKGAEKTGAFFASAAAHGSAHSGVDNDSTQQYLPEEGNLSEAWGAPPLNDSGIHVEQSGRASFSRRVWKKRYGPQLVRVAWLMADISRRRQLPLRWVSRRQMRKVGPNPPKPQGWVTHDDVSKVWKQSVHWDPGPGWPKGFVMRRARKFAKEFTKEGAVPKKKRVRKAAKKIVQAPAAVATTIAKKRPAEVATGFFGLLAMVLVAQFHIKDPKAVALIMTAVAGIPAAVSFLVDRGGVFGFLRRIFRGS
jgi:hypothetical protein